MQIWARAIALGLSMGLSAEAIAVDLTAGHVQLTVASHRQSLRETRKARAEQHLKQGIALALANEFQGAIQSWRTALSLYKELNDSKGEAAALDGLGLAYSALAQYGDAIKFHKQALVVKRSIAGDYWDEADSLGRLGRVHNFIGQHEQAVGFFYQALDIAREIGDRWREARSLGRLGWAYHSLGKHERAIDLHKQALKITRAIGERWGEGTVLGNLGVAYASLKDYKQAIDFYNQALHITREMKDQRGEARFLDGLGVVHASLSHYQQASDFHHQALKITRETKDRQGEATVLSNLGVTHVFLKQYEQAELSYRQSMEIGESIERDVGKQDRDQISFFETRKITYSSLTSLLVNQSKAEAALEIADRSRARSLAQFLTPSADNKSPTPLNIDQIKQLARDKNATLITYSIVGKELYIWVVFPDGDVEFRQTAPEAAGIPIKEITSQIRRSASSPIDTSGFFAQGQFRIDLQSLRGGEGSLWRGGPKDLKRAYELLIKPIENLLPTQGSRLIVVPHRELGTVPFAALIDDHDRFLLDRYALSITPSLQTLHTVQQTQPTGTGTPLIVGNPSPMPDQLNNLPGSEQEATAIAQALGTTALTGKSATETTVKQRLQNASILHFATHGVVANSDRQINDTWLALADVESGEEDGKLTLTEIFNTPLNAQLAVLSACNTNSGEVTGEGVLGLARAFLKSGVPTVIATLWKVPDTETRILMEAFYRELLTGKTYAEALRIGQLEVRAQSPNPRNWAAFVVIGDGDRTLELPQSP